MLHNFYCFTFKYWFETSKSIRYSKNDLRNNSQQNVFFWLTLEEIVESNLAQLLDGEVLCQADPAGEEREGVAVERLGVEPDGVGDGQDPALDVFHVFSESKNFVFPTFALPGSAQVIKSINLIFKNKNNFYMYLETSVKS